MLERTHLFPGDCVGQVYPE